MPLTEADARQNLRKLLDDFHKLTPTQRQEMTEASVVRQFAQQGQVQNLAVEDEGTVTDIDTVQDLERAECILAMRQTA